MPSKLHKKNQKFFYPKLNVATLMQIIVTNVFFQRSRRNEKVGPLTIEIVILIQQNGSVQSHNTPLSTRPQRPVKAQRRKTNFT